MKNISLAYISKNTKYASKNLLGTNSFTSKILKALPFYSRRIVASNTDVCIAGFPRSGNTFVYEVWHHFNPELVVSHHIHLPFNVLDALRLKVPVVVLIREPLECLSSLLVVDENLSLGLALWSYQLYYEKVWPLRKEFVISGFPRHTENLTEVTTAFNQFSGTSVACPDVDETTRQAVFATMTERTRRREKYKHLYAGPSSTKNKLKVHQRDRVRKHPRFQDCMAIYQRYVGESV